MLRCVVGVLERIVGVLVLARSAWFVHAVTDGYRCRVGAEPGGCSGEEPFGCVVGVPRYHGVGAIRLPMRRPVVVGGLWGGCGGVL